jgi:myosin-1
VDLLLTSKAIFLIGKQRLTKGLDKGKLVDSLARRIPLENIKGIDLSPYQDDLFVVHVLNEHSNLLETPLKTEFLTALW